MSERDKLKELEREVREASAREQRALEATEKQRPAGRHKRPIKRKTRRKILVGVALVLTFLLIWKKVNIHFVVFTSFWGFLGIVLTVFVLAYLILTFFFETSED